MSVLSYHVELAFSEDAKTTQAEAFVELRGQRFHGFGRARRSPGDPEVPLVGEELAAARAFSDLAHKLFEAAADRIDQFEPAERS